jgi:hypothetical protein
MHAVPRGVPLAGSSNGAGSVSKGEKQPWSSPGAETPVVDSKGRECPWVESAAAETADARLWRFATRRAGVKGGIPPVWVPRGAKALWSRPESKLRSWVPQGARRLPWSGPGRSARSGSTGGTILVLGMQRGWNNPLAKPARCDRAWLAHPDIRISRVSLRCH